MRQKAPRFFISASFILLVLFIPIICFSSNIIWVKYRSTPIDLDNRQFELHDTSVSSWIRGVWYDKGNDYLIINLSGTYYHYCGVPTRIWSIYKNFKQHQSYGRAYRNYLKGQYDCRLGYVPDYN